MPKLFQFSFLFVLLLCKSASLYSQVPVYKMPYQKDTTVTDCKGEFYDCDLGPGENYKELSDDIFRICTGGTITMSFLSFQLENGSDTLFFYNGSIGPGNLIGAYTGSNSPGSITATGCLVMHFKSSFVLEDAGWSARWTSTIVPPVPPTISISPAPSCNSNTVDITMSKNIPCDSAYASAFQLTGPINPTVTNATAIGCVGDSTTSVRLTLSIPLNQNCDYTVNFTINMLDNCDSIWTFTVNNLFTMIDCPPTVNIVATPNDSICAGGCVDLEAIINSCLAYNYTWSHGLPNQAQQNVCPASTTTYSLDVQSTSGGPVFSSNITITVEAPQITAPSSNPVCQSEPPFNLMANPPGGIWTGLGITDSIMGTFDPDTSGMGIHTIVYTVNGICSTTLDMVVTEMDAGLDEAACPGSPAFSLSGFTPTGGTWSGYAGLTPPGVFDPTSIGTYTVTYTHPNGCSDFKQVFVDNLVISSTTDTVCESAPSYTMNVNPPGGRWIPTTGLLDTVIGIIDPSAVGSGFKDFYYRLNGCSDTAHVYIKPIDAGNNLVFCPEEAQSIITASPSGGIWTSAGTNNGGASPLLNGSGLFDPGIQGPLASFRDTLIYTASNGCFDSIISYVYATYIGYDSLFFCSDDNNNLILNWGTTNRSPGGGVWTGAGVSKLGNDYFFNAQAAGAGIHTLTYEANACSDTILMIVSPSQLSYSDTLVCTTQAPFLLDTTAIFANWSGQGIVNSASGLFDPSQASLGTNPMVYTTNSGCRDTIHVTMYAFQPAKINGLKSNYCYTTTPDAFSLVPAGGTLTGSGTAGIIGNDFIPSLAGEGTFTLYYEFGVGPCYTSDSISIEITAPISTTLTLTGSPICKGDGATLEINSLGGNPNVLSHTYTWSNGLFPTNTHVLSPNATTTYTVTTSDGCSDDVVETVTIIVNPEFTVDLATSAIDCDGTPGTATATVTGPNNYAYEWSTNPVETGNSINGNSGSSYFIKITDVNTGCFKDSVIKIPGYGIINSHFSINPNLPCIPFQQNVLTFIDLSLGATQGYWELGPDSNGDGERIPYVNGENPIQTFPLSGQYTMLLHVENSGNCVSEKLLDFCILDPVSIFVPDIFSPNEDGENDICFVRGKGIRELSFIIYDRWGKKVFETNHPEQGWDGTFNGKDAETGVYVWYLTARMFDESTITDKGDLSLVR